MAKLITNYSKVIIPFVYDRTKKPEETMWERINETPQHLNHETVSKINGDDVSKIGDSFKLTPEARHRFNLPKDNRSKLDLVARQVKASLSLNNVYLYLFENDIGFIEFDVTIDAANAGEFLHANYFLFELESINNTLTFHKRLSKDEIKDIDYNLAAKAKELLGDLFIHSFDSKHSPSLQFLKPHSFIFLLCEECENELGKTLFRVKNVFKDSYQVTELEAKKDTYQPFSNINWGFSLQGVAVVSHLTGNNITDDFIKSGFLSATRMQYHYLYLLSLNRKYCILKQNTLINKFNGNFELMTYEQLINTKEQLDDATADTLAYLLRNDIKMPSEEIHINHYHDLLENSMEVDRLEKRLSHRLKDLSLLSETYQARIVMKNDKKNQQLQLCEQVKKLRIEIVIFVITQIIGSVSLFKLVWEVIEKVVGDKVPASSWLISIPIIAVFVFIMVLFLQIYLRIVEVKKLKIKIEEDDKGCGF